MRIICLIPDNNEAVNFEDIIVLCVKPQHIKSLLADILKYHQ